MLIHIQDDIVRLQHSGLLDRILIDKTTKKNIMWATDAYAYLGRDYERNEEICSHLITGENVDIIKTRARKEFEQQNQRTRKRAEVFTPVWICRFMNDKIDEEWFGYPNVFFNDNEPIDEVKFFEKKHTWRDYVDSRRLEITCGEAPFLMSRYDVATGEIISIEKRCGIFDRKLRVVTENTSSEEEWFKWAIRAVQATYGYEFQGDNVLIARINILCTFEDYLLQRWNRKLTRQETEKIINIISWNIWQMDGLTFTIPFREAEPDFVQLSLFHDFEESLTKVAQPLSRVYDWRRDNSCTFEGIKKGENRMKFDFIIGNPPYHEEKESENNTFAPAIYNKFLDNSFEIADKVEMIHPARFLFNAGQTPKKWNEKMLSDPHFRILFYEQDASRIFANTEIKGGVVISYRDAHKDFGAIKVFSKHEVLNKIIAKLKPFTEDENFSDIMSNQNKFDLDNLYLEYPEYRNVIGSNGRDKRFRNNIFDKIDIFTDNATSKDDIRVIGVTKIKGTYKRTYKFFPKRFIDLEHYNIKKWKVLVGAANGKGVLGEALSEPIILKPYEAYTQTYIGIGAFDTKEEAINLLKYIKTKFLRTMLGVLKITQHNPIEVWKYIPLQDFTASSDIDWAKSVAEIDRQLYTKYGLDKAEIEFVETHAKEME